MGTHEQNCGFLPPLEPLGKKPFIFSIMYGENRNPSISAYVNQIVLQPQPSPEPRTCVAALQGPAEGRAGLDAPCGSPVTQNIVWICESLSSHQRTSRDLPLLSRRKQPMGAAVQRGTQLSREMCPQVQPWDTAWQRRHEPPQEKNMVWVKQGITAPK